MKTSFLFAKKMTLPALLVLLASGAAQANTQVSCQGTSAGAPTTMAFELNPAAHTITFSDVNAFGGAQIQKNIALGMQLNHQAQSTEISFEYDWYYTAQYQLSFAKNLDEVTAGQSVELRLNGADSDGAFFNDVRLTCTIK